MKREEAVNRFKGIRESFSISIAQSKFYPSKVILDELCDMAIEALSAEQKEEELAKDIARRMATIIENEQDMRVILKNASAEPNNLISREYQTSIDYTHQDSLTTDLISRAGVSNWLSNTGHDKLASAVMDTRRFPPECAKGGDAEIPSTEQYPYMKQSPTIGADLISRADALNAIDYRRKTANIDGRILLDEVEDRIRELPSAEAEWIPCDTSGMPPDGEEVLVSDGKHIWIDETVAGDATEDGYMMWWGDGSDWIGTAWMPLPEPYKGGDTE